MPRRFAVVLLTSAALGPGALSACEQRYSGDAPANAPTNAPAPEPASTSSSAFAAVLALDTEDAGKVVFKPSHALVVTNCGWPTQPCPGFDAKASPDGNYRVTSGSGQISIRSRGQAMSDLYREMRDKTSAGQRLDIEARSPNPGGASSPAPPGSMHPGHGTSTDPITQASFVVLELVDNIGEADVDVVYGGAADHCVIALGRAADAGAGSCLLREPEVKKRTPVGTGLSW